MMRIGVDLRAVTGNVGTYGRCGQKDGVMRSEILWQTTWLYVISETEIHVLGRKFPPVVSHSNYKRERISMLSPQIDSAFFRAL